MNAKEILKTKKIFAVIGVTQDETKFGFDVYDTLTKNNYKVYPINPKYSEIAGQKCYASINELPEKPEVVVVVLSPQNSGKIVDSLVSHKDIIFWFPPECWSDDAIEKLKQNKLTFIHDVCPVGILKGYC